MNYEIVFDILITILIAIGYVLTYLIGYEAARVKSLSDTWDIIKKHTEKLDD